MVWSIRHYASEATIQIRGCGVHMAANDENIKIQILDDGALEVVVMAMVYMERMKRYMSRGIVAQTLHTEEYPKHVLCQRQSVLRWRLLFLSKLLREGFAVLTLLDPT